MSDTPLSSTRSSWLPVTAALLSLACLLAIVAGPDLMLGARSQPTPATPVPNPVPMLTGPMDGPRGKIAFVAFEPQHFKSSSIRVVDPASREVRQLIPQIGTQFNLAWLPDRRTLTYLWDHPAGNSQVVVQRVDGLDQPHILTNEPIFVGAFAVSPDGRQIVYKLTGSRGPALFLIDVDGRNRRELSGSPNGNLSWSGDGSRIVFMSEFYYHALDMALLRMDGQSKPVRLEGIPERASMPAWSPDGKWIAYLGPRQNLGGDLCLIRPDGTGNHCPTNNQVAVVEYAWSPDGTRIAFSGLLNGRNIWVLNVDPDTGGSGYGLKRLTKNTYYDIEPVWSPDGTQIAFVSNKGGESGDDIWVINPDGSGLAQLTEDPTYDMSPAWSR